MNALLAAQTPTRRKSVNSPIEVLNPLFHQPLQFRGNASQSRKQQKVKELSCKHDYTDERTGNYTPNVKKPRTFTAGSLERWKGNVREARKNDLKEAWLNIIHN